MYPLPDRYLSLGDRHYLHSDGEWLSLSHRRRRLVRSAGSVVALKARHRRDAVVDYNGYGVLHSRMFIMSDVVAVNRQASLMYSLYRPRSGKHRGRALTQGSQFTSVAFTDVLKAAGIAISKGAQAGTMFLSSASGAASNTRRSTSAPTPVFPRRAPHSTVI
jgi:hypothetical protein